MGKLSTSALVNETGVISLTTCSALIVFMATIILKDALIMPTADGRGEPLHKIECSNWHKSLLFDGVEVWIDNKRVTIPIVNIVGIIG